MDTKKCSMCGTEKFIGDFYLCRKSYDSKCKDCRKLLVRQYRDNNAEKVKAYDRERGKLPHRKESCINNTRKRRKDPDGYMAAHNAIARALRNGALQRLPCCMCGTSEKIHAHHDDYMKPLEVMWLCVQHHKSRHAFLDFIGKDIF